MDLLSSSLSYNRNSNHLHCLAKVIVWPEDVVLVLVAAPVMVGGGSATSVVLREVGGGIDLLVMRRMVVYNVLLTSSIGQFLNKKEYRIWQE